MNPLVEKRCEAAVERWLRILPHAGNRSFDVAHSSLRLVNEYLRRVALWARILHEMRELSVRDSIEALSAFLSPAPGVKCYEERLNGIRLYRALNLARNHIHWIAGSGDPRIENAGMPEPFEPLVRLFEHGGELFIHNGFVHVNHCCCFYPPNPLAAYGELSPLTDMSNDALDVIDKQSARNEVPKASIE